MTRASTVDEYIASADSWQAELARLCEILRSTPLAEEIKWGAPCYTYNGKNVVGVGGFKSYFGLWFHQGALLTDNKGVLLNAQEGKTKALRQWRMNAGKDIKPTIIKRYVKEAIELVEQGKEIKATRDKPVDISAELSKALRQNKGATDAFRRLRPGLQREYAEYINAAKREDTKARRIARVLPMILAGVGLNDKYRRQA
ncbi:MAG: DUF1801 domain-containing protein [Woeseiaceae bacterium]